MISQPIATRPMPRFLILCGAVLATISFVFPTLTFSKPRTSQPPPAIFSSVTAGSLISLDDKGRPQAACPLQHTDVDIDVSGFLARATVTQQFENPFDEKIEAVYTFPLPQRAAVDDMTLTVGDRVVKAKIKRREEAQALYETAKTKGHVAGLLDQERPNIFTQSVANIMPGEQVTVTISYVETLKYEDGWYELMFPMVVGPRYIPGSQTGKVGVGWAYGTDQVPDASRMTPPVTPPTTRAGHDISLNVKLDAGLPVDSLHSVTHEVIMDTPSANRATVRLKDQATIPNQDFILKFNVAGRKIEDALLTHRNGQQGGDGFFTFILQPPDRIEPAEVNPKELVFVLDTSGSMSGFPIEKAKETMKLALDGLYPRDTFNLITFAGSTRVLFPKPVPATKENLRKAQEFLSSRRDGGGTEMMKAIRTALAPSDSQAHVRIVCFMTDGYVGNDMAIVAEIQKHPNARVFSFGIGSSVNRFLLEKMAEYGRGEVEYVGLHDDGSAAARRFHERVRNPLLTDISVEWGDLQVADVYPTRIPDLFSTKPVLLTGRYTSAGTGTLRLRGKMAGRIVTKSIQVDFPSTEDQHDVLATLWARTKIAHLMGKDFNGIQRGTTKPEVRKAITQLGLDYRLLTQFTSFVAVEEMTITEGGVPRRIDVPVEMPEGVSYEGVLGDVRGDRILSSSKILQRRSFNACATCLGMGKAGAFAPPPSMAHQKSRGFASLQGQQAAEEIAQDEQVSRTQADPDLSTSLVVKKFHGSVASVVTRLKDTTLAELDDEADFVKNGKAEVQVWLTNTEPETLATLKKLGLEILLQPKTGTLVIGRIAVEKLEALAKLKAVRYIAPQLSRA